ncbi:MAG: hypothetical protein ABIB93_06360 [Chloroflexota bacterium]
MILQVFGFSIGIVSMVVWFVAIIPFLGWINWFNIPFAAIGLALSIAGVAGSRRSAAIGITGIVLCSVAVFFGAMRLQACGGII